MPAQPEAAPPRAAPPGSPREARGRRNPRRSPRPSRWGALQGGLGVCIVVASAAVGTIVTMVTRSAPGFLLGLFVEAGTVVAALAVRPRAGWMIFPVPVLSYLVGALVSGFVHNRSSGASGTALAIGAAQWIADGFFAMALATVLAIAITTIRWCLWRRRRPAPPRRPQAAPRRPEGPRAQRGPRGREDWNADPRWSNSDPRWSGADQRRGARRPGPRPGTGPYNFSSGA